MKIIPQNIDFNTLDTKGIYKKGYKKYIIDFPIIDTGWTYKKWFQIDLSKLRHWYDLLEQEHSDCKFIQGKHKHMWVEDPCDPNGKVGHKFMDDNAWYTLCWNPADVLGPLPPQKSGTKDLYKTELDTDDLSPRNIFTGYGLEISNKICSYVRTKKVSVSILMPGTKLITHQDAPDKFRFHISLYNNSDSFWIINNERLDVEADGWVYIINTSYPHSVYNNGKTPRINLYGKIFTEDVLKLDL